MICEKCSKEIKLEYGDPHYPDGKHLGVYGFWPLDIWLCYDCNEKYKNLISETDWEWKELKKFLK